MKRFFTLSVFSLLFQAASSQDIGVTSITSPVSGCSLGAAENVTIRIFNFGATNLSSTTFTVSYTLDGGPPVSESVSFPSFLPGTTVNYTFATQGNFISYGSYTVDAYTTLTGDVNAANDATTGYIVTNYAPSVGGSISGGGGVCVSGNSGTLTLAGHTGNVLDWQYTTDGGTTWITISNTTTSQNYNNVTVPTSYRARVQNASCATALSSTADLTIDPVTVAGSVTSNATVCSGSNSGTLTLSGHTGSVTGWEFSTDGGATWTPIANVTTSQNYTNIVTTTRYRSVVKSGVCASANSGAAIITVTGSSVGGTLNGSASICSGSNSGTLTLTGYTGTIIRWENSTDGGATWNILAITSSSVNYSNYSGPSVNHRVLVQNSPCAALYSTTSTLTVIPATVGGTVSSNASVCAGTNSGTLTLGGHTGSIVRWEYSINGGGSWTNIANTTTSQGYTNLTTTTMYRALCQQPSCPTAYSSSATITVSPVTAGGTTSPASATVCNGSNSGTITLAGNVGSVQRWEYSIDGGSTWTNIANTTTSQGYTNLTTATQYRAYVQSGVCAAAYSSVSSFSIDPITVAGTVVPPATVCSGTNGGTLTLGGHAGSILRWEYSIDGGSTWTSIANTTTTESYVNLTTTTQYRSVVQSGVCPAANSAAATITVDPLTAGGTASPAALSVCDGSNSGTIILAGNTGSVVQWEYSTDGGTSWTNIVNTTTSQAYTNLTTATQYRAYVQSGVCPGAYSSVSSFSIDPVTVAGMVSSSASVCTGINSGTLTLSGHAGNILNWEYSTDGGTIWTVIANTTTTESYTNLSTTTHYRAVLQNGSCPSANSVEAIIQVDPVSVAGNTASPALVCAGSNSGTISLSGNTGNVLNWESSTDGGITWTSIANTSLTQTYLNLTDTTQYRALVQSGVCPPDTSGITTITVDPMTVGGNIASGSTVCSGTNSGTLTLGGFTGGIIRWEYSIDGGSTWLLTTNTTNTQSYNNITIGTMYRVQVKSGICPAVYSATASLDVDPVTSPGTLSSNATVCSTSNSGTITLSGYTGNILGWESSSDGGTTWTSIANTSASQTYSNLTITTLYRTHIKSGVCTADTSNTVVITVDQQTAGGMLSPTDTVCSGANSGTITLSGHTGSVLNWESSSDGGITWLSIASTNPSLNYANLSKTTFYRTSVKNGVCPAAYSSVDTIKVDPVSAAGLLGSDAAVCSISNGGTITLSGYTGNILGWESSSDGGTTWTSIANTSASQAYSNLTITTLYRTHIKSGVCTADTSNTVVITVDQQTAGGMLSPTDTVCSGANSGTITLSGHTGSVLNWESSSDGGITWLSIASTNASISYANLTRTTLYRASVKNGVCPAVYSSLDTISVDPVSSAGLLGSDATVCSSSNSGTIMLSGYTGNILGWESSSDGGTTWAAVAGTSALQNYNNLSITTLFRAYVKSGVCPEDTSNSVTITVDEVSAGGVTAQADTVCSGSNSGMVLLSGHSGSVTGWEFSTDNGASWMSLSNTGFTQNYVNLTKTTLYRAIVKSGVCPMAYSTYDTITVSPLSDAGMISGTTSVCEGSANGNISLSNYTGSIYDWEFSSDNGLSWMPLGNSSPVINYSGLSSTAFYRAIVQSGACPPDTSATAVVTIHPAPQAMFSANNVCAGQPVSFANTSTIVSGGIRFHSWDFGDGNTSITKNPVHMYAVPGVYAVMLVTVSDNNCSDTSLLNIAVSSPPDAGIITNGPTSICSGDSVSLFAPNGGSDLSYSWSTGATTASIVAGASGVYRLTVTDTITGCSDSDSVKVSIYALPLVSAGKDSTIKKGSSIALSGSGGASYLWTPAYNMSDPLSPNPVVTPTATTIYVLVATDINGCLGIDSVKITLSDEYDLEISNIITPNGDGYNDAWYIRNIELFPGNEVSIFNRYGQEVYQASDYSNNWDGDDLPDGSYFYALRFNGTDKVLKGAITILREK